MRCTINKMVRRTTPGMVDKLDEYRKIHPLTDTRDSYGLLRCTSGKAVEATRGTPSSFRAWASTSVTAQH